MANPLQRRESIQCFVAPESAAHLSKSLFHEWLNEASDAIGMPMTAHNFRHRLASILLKRSLGNLEKVAKFLGNTPAVMQRNYAWINTDAVIEAARAMLATKEGRRTYSRSVSVPFEELPAEWQVFRSGLRARRIGGDPSMR